MSYCFSITGAGGEEYILYLTPREAEVMKAVRNGKSDKQIALDMNRSRFTINNHVRHVMAKVGAHSRLEALARIPL
jgi:DNA-binding NarL/FixJ family response regulator